MYQSLTSQLRQLKTDLEIRQREKSWIEAEMAKYNQRIQNTPGVEQEMLSITRSNAELEKQHEELKTKLEQAKLAGSLENRQKGEQFEIIDPANYPLEPSPPGQLMILLTGFGISLAVGMATAFVVNTLNQRVWTHHELERAVEAQVLVEIPTIVSTADLRRVRFKMLAQAIVGVFCVCLYLGGIYYLYLKQSAVLRLLDPLIEKIAEKAAG